MRIKGFNKGEVAVWVAFFIFALFNLLYFFVGKHIKWGLAEGMILVPSCLILQAIAAYSIGYKTKYYDIDESGICETWYGFIKVKFDWLKFVMVEETYIFNKGITRSDARPYKAIILSKMRIKKIDVPTGSYGYTKMISINWLKRHPSQIIALDLDFLKPGQYEEFWSYVPERLKGNFKPQEQ